MRGLANAVILLSVVVLAGSLVPQRPARLVLGASVADDLEALAQETWQRFLAVFWARRDCFGDIRLEAAYGLNSRAGYYPDTMTATVRVPGTAAMLQSGLVHEWAHHLEFQCGAHSELQPAFLAAQGLAPDTPWRPAGSRTDIAAAKWASIPSEQYAEATVALVLGGRSVPTKAHVSPEAIRVVEQWAEGKVPRLVVQAEGE